MTLCPFSLRTTYFSYVYSRLTVVVVCVYLNILEKLEKTNFLHEHTIKQIATIKRRENRKASFRMSDMTSLRSNCLFEYVISQREGEKS